MAATRLLALAGAGGIALTAWALRRSSMGRRALASGLTTFYAVLYAIFIAVLVLAGVGPGAFAYVRLRRTVAVSEIAG